jgi:predicted small secreted protein
MNTRHTTLTIVAAAAIAAALAGCNTTADAGPITSATKTALTSTTAPATPTASTSTTVDPAAKEAQDRQAAELVWRQFNGLIGTLESLPSDQVDAAINAVAVDPTATRMRDENAKFRGEHKAGYGQIIPYISWPQPIDGKDTAVLSDCQDGSQAGVLDTKTGFKLTVGTPNTPVRGTLRRTPQGWKVATGELVQGATCTPGK